MDGRHEAATSPIRRHIESGAIDIRAVLAVSGEVGKDQARISRTEVLVAYAELVKNRGLVVRD